MCVCVCGSQQGGGQSGFISPNGEIIMDLISSFSAFLGQGERMFSLASSEVIISHFATLFAEFAVCYLLGSGLWSRCHGILKS